MKKINSTKAILLAAAVIVACLVGILVFRRNDDLSGTERRTIAETQLHLWMNCSYLPIDESTVSNVVSNVELKHSGSVDLQYVPAAREAASHFLSAFSAGDIEKFRQFRFPAHAEINKADFERMQAFRKSMRERKIDATNVVKAVFPAPPKWSIDPKYLQTHPWPPVPPEQGPPDTTEITYDNFTEVMVRRTSQQTFYKGYFEALCPQQSILRIEHSRATPMPIDQYIETQGFQTLGVTVYGSTPYLFEHTPETELAAGRDLVLLTFVAMVRLQAPDTYTPFFVRYYFSPSDRVFIPFQFALGNFHRCSEIGFFF